MIELAPSINKAHDYPYEVLCKVLLRKGCPPVAHSRHSSLLILTTAVRVSAARLCARTYCSLLLYSLNFLIVASVFCCYKRRIVTSNRSLLVCAFALFLLRCTTTPLPGRRFRETSFAANDEHAEGLGPAESL